MKKIGSLFIKLILVVAIVVAGVYVWKNGALRMEKQSLIPSGKYGDFLAAQHAIYINDFDAAAQFSESLDGADAPAVQNVKTLSGFLSGKLPDNAAELKKESGTPARLIYDAYLVNGDNWEEMYSRHKNDKSALAAPLRIWSSIAINHKTEALKFIDSLETSESWKSFVRGQIYAETGDVDKAEKEFTGVKPGFMNINDYLYIMSFYNHNGMAESADALREEFTAQPGGMFMANFNDIPDWGEYGGLKNALAFSLIQNVSHTQVMMYSDLAVLLLRFAQTIGVTGQGDGDAINYYLGQFFFNNGGNYEHYFSRIKSNSPFYPFAMLRIAEGKQDVLKLHRVLRAYPTFVPAINKLVAHYVSVGDRRAALRILNRAMDNEELSDANHAFFLKRRAEVYFTFDDMIHAQSDIRAASDVLGLDADILALQAKIWAIENREIETAYEYAMNLVQHNPSDVFAWDVLGRVVATREGDDAALEMIERVGEVAKECSSLFDNLGDLYMRTGNDIMARDAYLRAIELSNDGLVVVPQIRKKIRNIR